MRKNLLLYIFIFITVGSLYAQRTLERRETTAGLSVFVDKDPEIDQAGGGQAGAIISCPITLELSFSSNVDRTIDVYKTEERGDVRFYYLRLIVGRYRGASYANRLLEVAAPGFAPLRFLLELQPSESKSFEIFDPNATVGVGCFYQHFNEGTELFQKALYNEAREKYRLSMECTDMPADADIPAKIRDIDSILVLRPEADKLFDQLFYKDASTAYLKIVSYNVDDQYAQSRAREAVRLFTDNCKVYFDGAELHFSNGDYAEAKKLYEMVLTMSCPKSTEAGVRLVDIQKIEYDRSKRIQVVAYEFSPSPSLTVPGYSDDPLKTQALIGLTVGAYKEKKFSGYFSLRFTPSIFPAMQKDYEKSLRSEFNVSAGWTTMKLQVPVWGFFGIGYTGVSSWDYEDLNEDGNPTFRMHSAISPEIGVLGKLGPLVLRYTFQYRFPLDKDRKEYIGQIRNVFGVGICF